MRNGVECGDREREGRRVKFAHLLGAALNTGIINVVERGAFAEHGLFFTFIFKGHLWVLEREREGDSQIAVMSCWKKERRCWKMRKLL